jgi:hypothetical protein
MENQKSKHNQGDIITISHKRKTKTVKIVDVMNRTGVGSVSYVYGFVEELPNGKGWSPRTKFLEEYQIIYVTPINN